MLVAYVLLGVGEITAAVIRNSSMLIYLLLHVLLGLVVGGMLRYLLRSNATTQKSRSWLAYIAGLAVGLSLTAANGRFDRQEPVQELWKWWGMGLTGVMFFLILFVGRRPRK